MSRNIIGSAKIQKKKGDSGNEDDQKKDKSERNKYRWSHYRKKKEQIIKLEEEAKAKSDPPKAVLFVPNTVTGELASSIRQVIRKLKPWTGLNIEVVERAGTKLQDLLQRSDPWANSDCHRKDCFTCGSSHKSEKCEFKNCHTRSIVYETWCQTCLGKKINVESKENGKRSREPKTVWSGPYYRYIGETSRSSFERGKEHEKDLEYHRTRSHLLKHAVEVHPNVDPSTLDFRMKILTSHKSAFERQLREAVLINEYSGPLLMNSKIEYSRSLLPRIEMKLGQNRDEKEDPDVIREKSVIEKIKLLWKSENKRTLNEYENDGENSNIENDENVKSENEIIENQAKKCRTDSVVEDLVSIQVGQNEFELKNKFTYKND